MVAQNSPVKFTNWKLPTSLVNNVWLVIPVKEAFLGISYLTWCFRCELVRHWQVQAHWWWSVLPKRRHSHEKQIVIVPYSTKFHVHSWPMLRWYIFIFNWFPMSQHESWVRLSFVRFQCISKPPGIRYPECLGRGTVKPGQVHLYRNNPTHRKELDCWFCVHFEAARSSLSSWQGQSS